MWLCGRSFFVALRLRFCGSKGLIFVALKLRLWLGGLVFRGSKASFLCHWGLVFCGSKVLFFGALGARFWGSVGALWGLERRVFSSP